LDAQVRQKGGGDGDAFVWEEEVPSLLSFKGGREGVVSKVTSLMQWFKAPDEGIANKARYLCTPEAH
jgi:hypothetical protein